jgi:Uma2 family endonuclease
VKGILMTVAVQTGTLRLVTADGETLASLDEMQGLWAAEQYLRLTRSSRRLIEFTNGELEVLSMPTRKHQAILGLVYVALLTFLRPPRRRGLFRSTSPTARGGQVP